MKQGEDGIFEWHHKDGSRMYWGIRAWPTDKREAWYPGEPESQWGVYWRFDILYGASSPSEVIGSGELMAQVELMPEPEEFFAHWVASLLPVCIGFAKYPNQWYGEVKP